MVKNFGYKLLLLGFVIILITGAIIYALQDNEKQARPNIDTRQLINDTTSFGGIDQKDYFLEQNVLDDKINIVEKKANEERQKLRDQMNEQTKTITDHMDKSLEALKSDQTDALKKTKDEILATVDEKLKSVDEKNVKNVQELEKKVKQYKDAPQMKLTDGKIIFPGQKNNDRPLKPLDKSEINLSSTNSKALLKEDQEEEYIEEEYIVDLSGVPVEEMGFDTGMEPAPDQNKSDTIEFDLTTSLVRVTLVDGVKAATLDIGLNDSSPVLMTIEGVKYAANDHVDSILKGCFLRGVGIGNINTSRVEIFGTHLSCIFEGDSGKLYKVEHDFPKNQVWIKGEDGADGVAGEIVESNRHDVYIDVKGGRKNLIAVFGGKTKLKATPYQEADLENY